jgi:hypothetical protein
LSPDLPSEGFGGVTDATEGFVFNAALALLPDQTWIANLTWLTFTPANQCAAEGQVEIDINPPIQTPLELLSSTVPSGQYCLVRFFNP